MSSYDLIKGFVHSVIPASALAPLARAHYARVVRTSAIDDEPDLAVVTQLIKPGDTVVDLGANIGVYTKVMSDRVQPGGMVLAVEPVPQTYRSLMHTVSSLGLQNVITLNCAVSDRAARVKMVLPRSGSGMVVHYRARIVAGSDPDGVDVLTVPIDSVIPDPIDRVAFVKCDVEGHELEVIRGALNLIEKSRPAWLIELSDSPDDPSSKASRIIGIMQDFGYGVWWYDGHWLRSRRAGVRSVNYFFLTQMHLAAIGHLLK